MANDPQFYMKDVLAAPLGEIISSVGAGIAEAQAALDAGSLAQTFDIYNELNDGISVQLLRDIGYQPTFYSIPETEVETSISLSMTYSENGVTESGGKQLSKTRMYATPTSASLTNAFGLNVQASTRMKFKIVAVPPPIDVQAAIVQVPDVVGMVLSPEAEDALTAAGLTWDIVNTNGNDETRLVTDQSIAVDKFVRRGTLISLTLAI